MMGESDLHPISPTTQAPQYGHKQRNKRKGNSRREKGQTKSVFLKPVSPTPSNTWSARSFHRTTER